MLIRRFTRLSRCFSARTSTNERQIRMIAANNVTYRVGKKALFEDVNIKFLPGECYGIIGANGAGKSTFLKILSGQLETTNGTITMDPGQRLSFLEQDQNKYDDEIVLDCVMQGNARLYEVMKEKDALYAKADFTDADGEKAAELETEFADMDGWNAESDAESLLNGLGIETDLHQKTMGELNGAKKVKVLLARALFGNIWIWTQSRGLKNSSSISKIRSSWSLTTATFSTRSAPTSPTSTMAKFSSTPATTISGSSQAA